MRLFTALAGALLLVSCSRETATVPPAPNPDAVAMVGTVPVFSRDLDHARELAGDRPAADVLRQLTEEEALAQMAVKEGVADDASVRAAVRRLLAARLLEKHTTPVTVTDEELATALQQLPPPAAAPSRRHLAFIRRKFDGDGGKPAALAALAEVRSRWADLPADPLRVGFGPLAAEVSDDSDTRYQGGDAGWLTDGQAHLLLPPAATTAAATLTAPGLVPGVIQTPDAAYVIVVIEIKSPLPPAPNPEKLRGELLAGKAAAARSALTGKALSLSPVQILQAPSEGPLPAQAPALNAPAVPASP